MSSKKSNKKRNRDRNDTPLASRRLQKGKILSPLHQLPAQVNWLSWKDDHLPNFLWAVMAVGCLDRKQYLNLFREIIETASNEVTKFCQPSLCHNFLSLEPRDHLTEIFEPISRYAELNTAIGLLSKIETLPCNMLWEENFGVPEDIGNSWNLLGNGVAKCLFHQSQEATDLRWLKLRYCQSIGKLHVPVEFESELINFPNEGDMRSVRPKIRAMEMTFRSFENGEDSPEGVSLFETEAFWQEMLKKTECSAFPLEEAKDIGIDRKALMFEAETIFEQLIVHFHNTTTTTSVEARTDGSFGLCFYALQILCDMEFGGTATMALGRIGLRTIVECSITLSFLRTQDDATLWKQYRAYGAGASALSYLKLLDANELPDLIDIETLELLANEDRWFEVSDIDIGSWSNRSLRKMAEQAGVKDRYDRFYDWASSFSHGQWGAIQHTSFSTCANPLHRFHRIPYPGRQAPSVMVDACKLINLMLDDLNTLYPSIKTRFKQHKVQAREKTSI